MSIEAPKDFRLATKGLHSILDFVRFGLSYAHAKPLFYGHGTDNAQDDIFALVLGSLALPLESDPIFLSAQLTEDEKIHLAKQLQRRIQEHVPVPYLTHTAYFCNLAFYVDTRVLIPRSPLAELIQHQFSPWIANEQVHRVLDLCTGSGCIAIACHYAFPEAEIDAVDISPDALAVCEINRKRHGVEHCVQLIESNGFDAIPPGQYDIIVSNPPYVGHEEMQTLPLEYQHEPSLALQADDEGLAIVEKILCNALPYLSPHGILVVEVGNSDEALVEKYPHIPFTWLEFERGGHGVFLLTYEQLQTYFSMRAV